MYAIRSYYARVAYSEKGSCVVVCAPTIDDINSRPGIWTTDLTGNAGYNSYNFV